MAISVTHRTTAGTGVDATSFTSASFTPAANVLLIASYTASREDNIQPTTPTVSGHGAWMLVDSLYFNDQAVRDEQLFLFGLNTGASPTASALTFNHGATTHSVGLWTIFEVGGSDVANGVAQTFVQVVKSVANTTGSSVTVTLAGASHSDNRSFQVNAHLANEDTVARANWTEIGDAGAGPVSTRTQSQWRSDIFEATTSASWATITRHGAMAFEIKAAVAAGPAVARRTLLGVGV